MVKLWESDKIKYNQYRRQYKVIIGWGIECPCGFRIHKLGSKKAYYNYRAYNQRINAHILECPVAKEQGVKPR